MVDWKQKLLGDFVTLLYYESIIIDDVQKLMIHRMIKSCIEFYI